VLGVSPLLSPWWAEHGVDGDDDGEADPHNAHDTTSSTAVEPCTGHPRATVDFRDEEQLADALSRHNPWDTTLRTSWSTSPNTRSTPPPRAEGTP